MNTSIYSGARQALPVVLGYLPVGFAFGVLVVQNGMPAWMAVLTSVIVYAGSAQLIAAGLIGTEVSALSIVATTFVVNLRHMLMATALSPWLTGWPRRFLVLFGLELTDETFALHSQSQRLGHAPVISSVLACNVTAQLGWVLGTALGAFSGDLLGDTKPFGLDFTLAAMFIALLVPQCFSRLHLLAAVSAALLAVALIALGLDRWAVVIATVTTACLAGWLQGRSQRLASDSAHKHAP